MSAKSIVIGIDGGGTHTRVMCTDTSGQVLAHIRTGGANPGKNSNAENNVRIALHKAITDSGVTPQQVEGLVAGFAGLGSQEDFTWARRFTTISGLKIEPYLVNDSVVAHAGALCLHPGIVAIAGTGSIILGVTDVGRQVSNYDFQHHTRTTARDLGYQAVFRILAGETTDVDAELIELVLEYFDVTHVPALAEKAATNSEQNYQKIIRKYGDMAPLVTEAASKGIPLACSICDTAVDSLDLGIRLVGSLFPSATISCALIGSVARSKYIKEHLTKTLKRKTNRQYNIVNPILSPEAGAVLIALDRLGIALNDTIINDLRR